LKSGLWRLMLSNSETTATNGWIISLAIFLGAGVMFATVGPDHPQTPMNCRVNSQFTL